MPYKKMDDKNIYSLVLIFYLNLDSFLDIGHLSIRFWSLNIFSLFTSFFPSSIAFFDFYLSIILLKSVLDALLLTSINM